MLKKQKKLGERAMPAGPYSQWLHPASTGSAWRACEERPGISSKAVRADNSVNDLVSGVEEAKIASPLSQLRDAAKVPPVEPPLQATVTTIPAVSTSVLDKSMADARQFAPHQDTVRSSPVFRPTSSRGR